jgi:hypothetical protein
MAKARTPRKKTTGNEGIGTSGTPVENTPENGSSVMASGASANGENGKTEMKTTAKRSTAKPEIVKSESRSNLVPINVEEEIRRLAYLMSERRGFVPGHETEDWLAAEHEIRERYHQVVHTA